MTADDILDDLIRREGGYVNATALAYAIKAAIKAAGQVANESKPHKEGQNVRAYSCSVDGCSRKAYARGYCNAHYIRFRSGADMSKPIRSVEEDGACSVCGVKRGGKGAWGMCANHYSSARLEVIKTMCVMWMGGRCADCGGSFPLRVFDFHHVGGDKESSISSLMANSSPESIADEISKCVLLCANCHRLRHGPDGHHH